MNINTASPNPARTGENPVAGNSPIGEAPKDSEKDEQPTDMVTLSKEEEAAVCEAEIGIPEAEVLRWMGDSLLGGNRAHQERPFFHLHQRGATDEGPLHEGPPRSRCPSCRKGIFTNAPRRHPYIRWQESIRDVQ